MTEPEIGWGPCCLCGEQIEESTLDPCRVTVETNEGKWQVWFCHAACFRNALPDNPLLEPAYL